MDGMDAGCHLEIVPRRGEMIFFQKGGEKGVRQYYSNSIKGGRE